MRDHKSLIAWQRAHLVVVTVLRACKHPCRPYAAAVLEQLQRAALSVQLNIAEGYALRTPARFRNDLAIAYGSAVETTELLELVVEEELLPKGMAEPALAASVETSKLLLGLLKRY